MNEFEILEVIKHSYDNILKDKLLGIYVHGSIAFNCFNWNKSDIDFIVVVKEKLNQSEKEALITELIQLDQLCPPKGFEMSVVLEAVCKSFAYPTPFELHYSNMYKERAIKDLKGYCMQMQGVDKDLAAHFTIIKAVGIVLYGKEINEVFSEVPKSFYIDSILEDVKDASENIKEEPVYFILNLCRVLAYLEDGSIVSKEQGGKWGIQKLPEHYTSFVKSALASYTDDLKFDKESEIVEFLQYMQDRIMNIKKGN